MLKKFSRSLALILTAFLTVSFSAAAIGFQEVADEAKIPLLIDVVTTSALFLDPVNPDVVVRQRIAALDDRFFSGILPLRLDLNLFDDALFSAVLFWIESGSEGGLVWFGRIVGQTDSRVTLVTHEQQASGSIWVDDRRFDLRPLRDGYHVIQEIDVDKLPPGGLKAPLLDEKRLFMEIIASQYQSAAMSTFERQVFVLVNQERSKYNLAPLSEDDRLSSAARAHSQDMSDNNLLSHVSSDGRTAGDRITAAGYRWNLYGENIARGYGSPEVVMNGWMSSSGHRANILNPSFCDLGVGHVPTGNYWTQNFGRQHGVAQCPPVNQTPDSQPPSNGSSGGGGCFVRATRD
jgi:hypothetical protein